MFPCFLYRIAVHQRNKRIYKTDWHLIRHGLSVTDQVSHKHSHIAFGYVLYTPCRPHKLKIQKALGASYLPQGRLRQTKHLSRTLLFKSVRQSGIQGISLGLLFWFVFWQVPKNEQIDYIKLSLCIDELTNIHLNCSPPFFWLKEAQKKCYPKKTPRTRAARPWPRPLFEKRGAKTFRVDSPCRHRGWLFRGPSQNRTPVPTIL